MNTSEIDFKGMAGVSDLLQSKQFIERFGIKKEAPDLQEMKRNIFLDLAKTGLDSPQGRNDFLEYASTSHIIGVVSSSSLRIVHEVLKAEKIASFFKFIIGYEDCQNHKPNPEPYQCALKKASVFSHEALVIEDSITGITSAQRAAIPVIGMLKDQQPENLVKDVTYFKSFSDIHTQIFKND